MDIDQQGQTVTSAQYNADTINMGISLADHEQALKRREHEVLERMATTTPSDRVIRELLQKELDAVVSKLSNLEKSFQGEVKIRAEIAETLEVVKEKLPNSISSTALDELNAGNKEAAIKLFDDVIDQAEKINKLARKAAYENGPMAENDIRYSEAKSYYLKSVKFQPDESFYLTGLAAKFIHIAGYKKAIEYLELALESNLKTFGEDHLRVARTSYRLGMLATIRENLALARSRLPILDNRKPISINLQSPQPSFVNFYPSALASLHQYKG